MNIAGSRIRIAFLTASATIGLLSVTGCLHVRPQEIRIETEPPGATAIAGTGDRCTTPCALRLPRIESQHVRLEMPGFESVDAELTARTWRSGAGAALGGTLIGGLGGIAVGGAVAAALSLDLGAEMFGVALAGLYGGMALAARHNEAVGAAVKLEPNPLHVVLKPEEVTEPPEDGSERFDGPFPNDPTTDAGRSRQVSIPELDRR